MFVKLFNKEKVKNSKSKSHLKALLKHMQICNVNENIEKRQENMLAIVKPITGLDFFYKPPLKVRFSRNPTKVGTTYSTTNYNRTSIISASQVFENRLQYELELDTDKLEKIEVELNLSDRNSSEGFGVTVTGVAVLVDYVPDIFNIYIKTILRGSAAHVDGRILLGDQIIEVNGDSLVGVSQELASEVLGLSDREDVLRLVLARTRTEDKMVGAYF